MVMASGLHAMVIEKFALAVLFRKSVTCVLNAKIPGVVGVPEILPEEARVRPDGREPLTTDQA